MSIQQSLIDVSANNSETTEFKSSYLSKDSCRRRLRRFCSRQAISSAFPILKWLPNYNWNRDFASDLTSGFITGVMLVPQGIAYAFLAGLDPINGLYSSFLSPFLYLPLGLSPHVSRGPSSVLGVMSQISNQAIHAQAIEYGIQVELNASVIASTLTFTCGLIQILMGLMQFRFLADYFSDPLISGFVFGAGIHTLVSQLNKFVGVQTKTHSSYLSAFYNIKELVLKVSDYRWQTIVLSICSIMFLFIGKFYAAPWIKRKFHLLIPCELILIIITTILSYLFAWESKMPIVGEVPSGFPQPQMPIFELVPYCIPHALAICCVTVALHFSMTKLFANKFNYSIDLSHELYAIGFGTTASGFFPTYPTSTALARTVVLVESGAKTQLASGLSSLLVLVVILFVGPLFQSLPQCVLSAIIVVSLKTVFLNFKSIIRLWNVDKFDFAIWCLSFFGTLFTNVIIGLGIGVLASLFTLIIRIQWPSWKFVSNGNSCVFKFNSPILFANCERFSETVDKHLSSWLSSRAPDMTFLPQAELSEKTPELTFIFDCGCINQIDSMGLQTLLQLVGVIEKQKIRVQFTNVSSSILKTLKSVALDLNVN